MEGALHSTVYAKQSQQDDAALSTTAAITGYENPTMTFITKEQRREALDTVAHPDLVVHLPTP